MGWIDERTSRGQFLRRTGALGALGTIGLAASACGGSSSASGSSAGGSGSAAAQNAAATLNWLTWADHYFPDQLKQVKAATNITVKPELFTDDAAGYLKLKQGGTHLDMISVDALWVTKEFHEGLLQPWDLSSIPRTSELYSVATQVPFWQAGSQYLVYPKGWSMSIIYYNPKYVTTKPDSWAALTDKQYAGKIVAENSASALLADAGVAVGAKDPTNMTSDELARAKDYLKALKPNILKLVSQGDEVIRALADESAWIGIQWLGTEYRVKDAGGPDVLPAIPSEGTTGWIDGETLTKASTEQAAFFRFVNAMETPEWTAQIFLKNGHPMMNEKAYKVLVDHGQQERADKSFYNRPELAMQMKLWGPADNQQAYTDAFNEVFGA